MGGLGTLWNKSARTKTLADESLIGHKLPNLSKFSTTKVMCYTVVKVIVTL